MKSLGGQIRNWTLILRSVGEMDPTEPTTIWMNFLAQNKKNCFVRLFTFLHLNNILATSQTIKAVKQEEESRILVVRIIYLPRQIFCRIPPSKL